MAIGGATSISADGPDVLARLALLPGVDAAVLEARQAIDRLQTHRSRRRYAAQLTAESALVGAGMAIALEMDQTNPYSVDDMRELARATEFTDPMDPLAAAALGALRAYTELPLLVGTWNRSPLQVLARLHVLAAGGTVVESMLGRPRAADDRLGPLDVDVSRRLQDLTAVLGGTRAPAIVVAAVVHAEISTIRPFVWGNTIVAIAAQRLTLAARGLDPDLHGVPEVGHITPRGAYVEALAAYEAGTPEGVTAWIRHVADAVVAGAHQGLAIGESLIRG